MSVEGQDDAFAAFSDFELSPLSKTGKRRYFAKSEASGPIFRIFETIKKFQMQLCALNAKKWSFSCKFPSFPRAATECTDTSQLPPTFAIIPVPRAPLFPLLTFRFFASSIFAAFLSLLTTNAAASEQHRGNSRQVESRLRRRPLASPRQR